MARLPARDMPREASRLCTDQRGRAAVIQVLQRARRDTRPLWWDVNRSGVLYSTTQDLAAVGPDCIDVAWRNCVSK